MFDLTYEISNGMFKYPTDSEPNIVSILSSTEVVDGVIRYRSGRQVLNMTNHHGTHIDAPFHKDPEGKKITDYSPSKFVNKAFLINLKNFGKINSNLQVGEKALQSDIFPSSPPKKSIEGFLGPKNSSEGIFRNPLQTPHFSVEYKSEGFGDFKNGQNYLRVIEEEHVQKKIPKEHSHDLVDQDISALIFYTGFCDLMKQKQGKLDGQEKKEFEGTFPYFSQKAAQYLVDNFPFLNIIGIDSFSVDRSGSNSEVHRIFFARDILPLETLVELGRLEYQVGYGDNDFNYPPSRVFKLYSIPIKAQGGDAGLAAAVAEI